MISVVHGKKLFTDQWTGESVEERFRIPRKGLKEWYGCFGSPSTALAALIHEAEKPESGLSREEANELIDLFETSLRRKPGQEREPFTIQPAPSFRNLVSWGGAMSFQEYHATYEHDRELALFTQALPDEGGDREKGDKGEKGEMEVDSDQERQPNAPKKWYRETGVSPGGDDLSTSRVMMPRCTSAWLDFLKAHRNGEDSVVVYFHPSAQKIFCVGSAKSFNGIVNRRASEILGNVSVFGKVDVYHKNKMRPKKVKGSKKKDGRPASVPKAPEASRVTV